MFLTIFPLCDPVSTERAGIWLYCPVKQSYDSAEQEIFCYRFHACVVGRFLAVRFLHQTKQFARVHDSRNRQTCRIMIFLLHQTMTIISIPLTIPNNILLGVVKPMRKIVMLLPSTVIGILLLPQPLEDFFHRYHQIRTQCTYVTSRNLYIRPYHLYI